MQDMMSFSITMMTVAAGMFFSLCLALLLEELFFGCLFHTFFARARNAEPKGLIAGSHDRLQGEGSCSR